MQELESLLGAQLYGKVLDKLNGTKLLMDNGKMIPKHRFDCINLSLKEHKEQVAALREKTKEMGELRERVACSEKKIADLEKYITILKTVIKSKAKNPFAVIALLQVEQLFGIELQNALDRQLRLMKKTDSYLFYNGNELYRLVPYTQNKKTE